MAKKNGTQLDETAKSHLSTDDLTVNSQCNITPLNPNDQNQDITDFHFYRVCSLCIPLIISYKYTQFFLCIFSLKVYVITVTLTA